MIWNILKVYLIIGVIFSSLNVICTLVLAANGSLALPTKLKTIAHCWFGMFTAILVWPITLVLMLYSAFGKYGYDFTEIVGETYAKMLDDTKNKDDKTDESH